MALASTGQTPPRPEEKERLLARLEEAAWTLPREVFAGCEDSSWDDRVSEHPEVEALLASAPRELARARSFP